MPKHWCGRAALLAVVLSGCAEPAPKRGAVRGSVTVDGQPVAAGKVRFFALTNGISAEGEIRDGRYEIPAEKGPTAGRYRVEISAEQKTGRKIPDRDGAPGDMKDETVNVIPHKFNRDSTLQIDYDPAADAPHDFRLLAK